jgi:SAM-dependent methyltransferase
MAADSLIQATTSHFGYDIPTRLMNLTGGGPDTFEAMCAFHMACLQEHTPIDPTHTVLEIGCGIGRDAIPLTQHLADTGRYLGIDIVKQSIDWCTANITTRYPNFQFVHYDVADQLHNPRGATATADIRIPVQDHSIDRIVVWSVFTHMAKSDIIHYLHEFARVLKPSGMVLATWFVVDDAILAKARTINLTPFNLRFEHQISADCYINDPERPMGAVAYTRQAVIDAADAAGLRIRGDILPGAWSGYWPEPKGGQDMSVLVPR